MKIYSKYGFKDFILCLGHKGGLIKQYFLNYRTMNSDFTLQLGNSESIQINNENEEKDWVVTLADTGEESQTGARIKKVSRYLDGDTFMVTYGDGVADINIEKLIKFHQENGKIGTVTGVRPSSRFGELVVEKNIVTKFHEKPQVSKGLINGGFFVFNRNFLELLSNDDNCYLERDPLERLASQGELAVFKHDGFWQCVDTYRELELLNLLWKSKNPPWKIW